MLESIEKLRKLSDEVKAHDVDNPICVCHKAAVIADEIEREISERYIERDKAIEAPLDADGVPIRPGDMMTYGTKEIRVTAISERRWMSYEGIMHQPDQTRHVKPDSLKELLDDVSKGVICYPRERVTGYLEDNHSIGEAVMLDVRDRLRELLGGDAE